MPDINKVGSWEEFSEYYNQSYNLKAIIPVDVKIERRLLSTKRRFYIIKTDKESFIGGFSDTKERSYVVGKIEMINGPAIYDLVLNKKTIGSLFYEEQEKIKEALEKKPNELKGARTIDNIL